MAETQVSSLLTRVGYKIFSNPSQTIGASSIPNTNECLAWLNAEARVLAEILAGLNSDVGRNIKRIVTSKATAIEDITQANPANVTSIVAHGLSAAGGTCYLTGVGGMYQASELSFTYTYVDTTNITIGVDSSAYDAYTGGGLIVPKPYYNDLAALPQTVCKFGDKAEVILDQNRSKMDLVNREAIHNHYPTKTGPPEEYYVDGNDNIYVLPHPDDNYILMIPYWLYPTTITQVTDSVPFYGHFDDLLAEGIADIYFNREEYDVQFEMAMKNFLLSRASVKAQKRRTYSGDVKG